MERPFKDERFPAMQRMAIKALTASHHDIVHAVLYAEADAAALLARMKPAGDGNQRAPSFTGLLLSAMARRLAGHPHLNAIHADDMRRQYEHIDIGLAVAGLDGSLSVPILRDVDRMSVAQIDEARRRLADKARTKRLHADDFGGAALTLSNIGLYRSIQFAAPVIPEGQGAILVVGAIYEQAGDKTMRLPLSFAFDHRVNNGAPAAAFLQALIDDIESV